MATERVYHPETCEPFDVPASKAGLLVLEKGWSRTPWTRVPVPAPVEIILEEDDEADVEDEAPRGRGRGRQRRPANTAPAEPLIDSDQGHETTEVDAGEPWRL